MKISPEQQPVHPNHKRVSKSDHSSDHATFRKLTLYHTTIFFLIFLSFFDKASASLNESFLQKSNLRILAAPVAAKTIPDQSIGGLTAFSIPIAKDTFTDADGDQLTYSATSADGSSLPSWIDFDKTNIQFNGIAPKTGNFSFTVKAMDATSSATATFKIIVTNPPPIIEVNKEYAFPVTTDFTIDVKIKDPNSDPFTSSAFLAGGQALPTWVTYDATLKQFKGKSTEGQNVMLEVRANDGSSTAIKNFTLRILPRLEAGGAIADVMIYLANRVEEYKIPPTAFSVTEGLSFNVTKKDGSPLPAWLKFADENDTFIITPHQDNKDPVAIKMVATDATGKSAVQMFNMITRNVILDEKIIKDDWNVNDNRVSSQSFNSVFMLKNGNILAVWESYLQDGSEYGLYARIMDQNGTMGNEFRINNEGENNQAFPATLSLNNGSVLITWQSLMQDGYLYGVYAKVIDQTGNEIVPDFRVNTKVEEEQSSPKVAQFANNNTFFVWHSYSQDGSKYGVYGKILDPTGKEVMPETQLNKWTNDSQRLPQVWILNGGNALVTWESRYQDGDQYGLFGKIFGPTGTVVYDEFQINSYFKSNQGAVQVLNLLNDNILIAWQSDTQDGSVDGIYGKVIDKTNKVIVPEFRINDYTNQAQTNLRMGLLKNGNIIFVWHSARMQPGDIDGVYAKIIDPKGSIVRPEFRVNDYTETPQNYPAMTIVNQEYIYVAWESYGQDGDGLGIFAKVLDINGNTVKPQFQVNSYTKGWQLDTKTIPLLDNRIFVGWSSETDGYSFDAIAKIVRYEINILPDIIKNLPDHSVLFKENFAFKVPQIYVLEYEDEPMTAIGTLEDGSPLPAWLTFDPATYAFSGTPQEADEGNFTVKFQVTDERGGSTYQMFNMFVSGTRIPLNDTVEPGEEPWVDPEPEPEPEPSDSDPDEEPPTNTTKRDKPSIKTKKEDKPWWDWKLIAAAAIILSLLLTLCCCICWKRRKEAVLPMQQQQQQQDNKNHFDQEAFFARLAQVLPLSMHAAIRSRKPSYYDSDDSPRDRSRSRSRSRSRASRSKYSRKSSRRSIVDPEGSEISSDSPTRADTSRPMRGDVSDLVMIPDNFLCPLTKAIMCEPWLVISEDQVLMNSYERENIQNWFKEHEIDPVTNKKKRWMGGNNPLKQDIENALKKITPQQMRADPKLRNQVGDWIRRRGQEELTEDPELSIIVENYKKSLGGKK